MLKKVFISIMLAGVVCGFSFGADEFSLLKEERIGNLRIGISETEVKKEIHCTLTLGPEELWGADGAYHQAWEYTDCGISLGMASEEEGGPKSVESITVVSPGTMSTNKGIRIGSTEQEVMNAYEPYWNKEDSEDFGNFVAGSIYGGLIFYFQNGQVSKIFLGAAAE